MRDRLILVITGTVAAAVTVVGLGTLVLSLVAARHQDQDELARRLEELAAVVVEVRPARASVTVQRLGALLDADEVDVVGLLNPPVELDAGHVARLRDGETVVWRRDSTIYAATPLPAVGGGPPNRALLASDTLDPDLGSAGRWFLVVGLGTVTLGGLLAVWLGRSLAAPLGRAEAATRRIADGDLTVRLPDEGDGDEVARLAGSINSMAAALERSRSTERDFLLSISHDLRTPLTSISGWAEALSDGTAPDPAAAGGTILSEAHRLDRLVRDLLELARLQAHSFTLNPGRVDLRDVAAGIAEGLRPDLEDAGLRLRVEVPEAPVVVEGDPDRLAQVAGNLLENAGHHAVGQVVVSVSQIGDRAVLAVDDDGPGIAPDDRAKVFERLHTGSPSGLGTGLGLAIVRELTRAMHGEARADRSPTGGARLEVRLPLAPADHVG